jgi:hypothetical protein
MKPRALPCLLLLGVALARAQSGAADDHALQAQWALARQQIQAQKTQLEAQFQKDSQACYSRFAVNDCLSALQQKKHQALAQLRQQEHHINDAQRQHRAQIRLAELAQRAAEKEAAAKLPAAPHQPQAASQSNAPQSLSSPAPSQAQSHPTGNGE